MLVSNIMDLGNQKTVVIGSIVVLLLGFCVYVYNHFISPSQIQFEAVPVINSPQPVSFASAVVHVDGAVRKPGVYRLKNGDRVLDAVEQAGGALAKADLSVLNLAEKVKDGQKIVVPSKAQITGTASPAGGKVSLNSAAQKQIESLPGIGPSTAKRIIEARPFIKLEDIMKVNRIGKKSFEKLKDKISL